MDNVSALLAAYLGAATALLIVGGYFAWCGLRELKRGLRELKRRNDMLDDFRRKSS